MQAKMTKQLELLHACCTILQSVLLSVVYTRGNVSLSVSHVACGIIAQELDYGGALGKVMHIMRC